MSKKKKILFITGCAVLSVLLLAGMAWGLVVYCNNMIGSYGKYCYDDVENIPPRKVALLLGVAKTAPNGNPNAFFKGRIEAAAKLYHAGKITHIIISGDNSRKDYNEPQDMKISLRSRGVPESAITLDYAGFRTLDSVLRSKNVFQKNSILIITQPGHAERAIYISRKNDIEASAFLAAEPLQYKWLIERNRKREKLACIAAWLDVNILRRRPKFVK